MSSQAASDIQREAEVESPEVPLVRGLNIKEPAPPGVLAFQELLGIAGSLRERTGEGWFGIHESINGQEGFNFKFLKTKSQVYN